MAGGPQAVVAMEYLDGRDEDDNVDDDAALLAMMVGNKKPDDVWRPASRATKVATTMGYLMMNEYIE